MSFIYEFIKVQNRGSIYTVIYSYIFQPLLIFVSMDDPMAHLDGDEAHTTQRPRESSLQRSSLSKVVPASKTKTVELRNKYDPLSSVEEV